MLQMDSAMSVAMLVHSGPQNVKWVVASQPNAGMKIQTMNILFWVNIITLPAERLVVPLYWFVTLQQQSVAGEK
jgi:hypothetical protein